MRVWRFQVKGKHSERRAYVLAMLATWIYTLGWIVSVLWIHLLWKPSIFWRIVLTGLLVIVTPAISDLFLSYDEYIEEGKRLDKQANSQKSR